MSCGPARGGARRARIIGTGEAPYARHPAPELDTRAILADAAHRALDDAAVAASEIDGLGVASFTLSPDRAIDLGVRLGLRLRWLMDSGLGGASGLDLLHHATRAVEAGDARNILLVAGDVLRPSDFRKLVNSYNVATETHLAEIPFGGPNSLFAMLTRRHMRRWKLDRSHYGRLVIHQRRMAGRNPNAVYREPITLDDYLRAPMVADPLCLFDCVPVVSGADAIVVSASGSGTVVRAIAAYHNADQHDGDGLTTGLRSIASELWDSAGVTPTGVDVISIYDDYPAVVLTLLEDLGFGQPQAVLNAIEDGQLALNTSGGQLSAGQAGAAAGMHGLVEVARQLRGQAGQRQVERARVGVVVGYGTVAYRYGACTNAAVLEGD